MAMTQIESDELRIQLYEGTVRFVFKKKDGTLRNAIGTTNLDIVPLDNHPTGNGGESSKASVRFFDMEKNAWRSCSSSTEIFLAD